MELEDLKTFIKANKLDTSARHRNLVYSRYYLYSVLRGNTNLTLIEIGKLFNRDHSSVVDGLNKYELFKDDCLFLNLTEYTRSYVKVFIIKYLDTHKEQEVDKRECFIINADIESREMLDVLLPFFNQYNTIVRYTKDADFIKVTKVTKSEFKKF